MENGLLEKAIDAVYRETGLRLNAHNPPSNADGNNYDATIDIEGYPHICFTAEAKRLE